MPFICFDENNISFPPVHKADEEGLLLIGGKLTADSVLVAYTKGIFPWYNEDEPVLWWCPDPRFVLFPSELHISRSMQKVLNQHLFTFKTDTAFRDVIRACKTTRRVGQDGTWITDDVENVYTELFEIGYAHSAETWHNDKLVGGMYGIQLGKVFFGESMFSHETNASKFAFIQFVQYLQSTGVELLDCQVYTSHVESLGARMISRKDFTTLLEKLL
jgi:leucyl/phenylalanyl-tRNA---protein transferase